MEAYEIAEFPLRIGDCNLILEKVEVLTGSPGIYQLNEEGSLGVDFILKPKEVIINFEDMFLKIEK